MIVIEKIDSAAELENTITKDNVISLDEVRNTYCKISIGEVLILGVEYYSHGIDIDYKLTNDGLLLFMGIGMHLLCVDIEKKKVLFIEELHSVFYEIMTDSNQDYFCIICELDLYCYNRGVKVWERGFRDILIHFNIMNDETISISCEDAKEYKISLKDGKIIY